MKTSFSLDNLISRVRQNISMTLCAALLVLLVAAGLVVKQSVAILLAAQNVEITPQARSVRVNFGLYNGIAERFSQETAFTPTPVTAKDPFGTLKFEAPPIP